MTDRLKELQCQVSVMAGEIKKIHSLLTDFSNCKGCIKKLYKATPEGNSPVSAILRPIPSVKEAAETRPTPPSTITACKLDEPLKASTPKTTTTNAEELPSKLMLVGSPSRGVYVQTSKIDLIKTGQPKLFALKLFELVFRREEAKVGSVEGKGEKLSQLDPNRIAAIREETEKRFGVDSVWQEIKKAIDEKCRMVRNNQCFMWAGVKAS